MHKSQKKLANDLSKAARQVQVGGLYYHYKNPDVHYRVVGLAITEQDDEICVIYEAQYGEKLIFVRPLASWLDGLTVGGKTVKRFTPVPC